MAPNPAAAGPALLIDSIDGKVLYAEDQDHVWHPASLTKIMTAYVVFEQIKAGKLKLDGKIAVSELANSQMPSKVGLPVGAEMTVDLALQALIVKSANDVAVMLAEASDGSVEAFSARMNATAKRLGMTRTHFVNPNGLPAAEQVTTARDLARLARAVLKDFPEYQPLWTMADMRLGRIRLRTHNGLLRTYDGADGLKTGFICDSGYNVVATATREGRRLVAVVLGEVSGRERNMRAASLLEHGFQTDAWRAVLQETQTVESLPVAADARTTVTTMRDAVVSWDCGRRRPVAASKAKQKRQALAKQAATAGKPGEPAGQQAAVGGAAAGGAAVGAAPVAKAKAPARPAAAAKATEPTKAVQ